MNINNKFLLFWGLTLLGIFAACGQATNGSDSTQQSSELPHADPPPELFEDIPPSQTDDPINETENDPDDVEDEVEEEEEEEENDNPLPFNCNGFSGEEPELCAQTEEACHIVFRDGSGCNAACAAAGLTCIYSTRDNDDNESLCAPHPTDMTAYGCEETGHQSDYCVCGGICAPICDGRTCGPDGCGGVCGTCSETEVCNEGLCEAPPPPPPVECRDNTPTFSDTVNINETIVIDEPGTYDYHNVLHKWTGSGSCNQTENQPYILRIAASNVTLKNFAYENAPDGIHIGTSSSGQGHSGGETISNIVLENVTGRACEDALTIQYGVQDVSIRDSLFLPNPTQEYQDKLFQLNFGNIEIARTTFWGGAGEYSTCVMFKGGQNIHVHDSCFMDCDRAINGSTIHGIIGNISDDRSDLLSERNKGHFPDRAFTFWDRWDFYSGSGDIHIISINGDRSDNADTDMDQGATLTFQ